MKTLTILFGFLSAFLIISPKNSFAQFSTKFKGNVKSYTLYDYYITEQTKSNSTTELELKEKITYNREGKQVDEIVYDTRAKDSVIFSTTRLYDNKGREIMMRTKDRINSKSSYSYNKDNNLIEIDSIDRRIIFKIVYNKDGARDTMFTNFTTDVSRNTVIYHYADEGRKVEQIWYKADGSINYKQLSQYDKFHNIIDQIKIRPDGTRENRETYKYDDSGNMLMEIDSNITFIGGLPMRKISDKVYSRTFRYDQFDKAGNWIQQSYLLDDQFILFSKREIEYY